MKITIEVDGHEAEELLELLNRRHPGAETPRPEVALTAETRLLDEEPRTAEEPTAEEADAAPRKTEEADAAPRKTAPSGRHIPVAPGRKPVEEVIADADQKLKRTGQTTLTDGTVIKEGSEVHDDTGELAIVEVTYRGNAVIRYDDGAGRFTRAADLTAVPDNDVPPESEPEPEPEAAPHKNGATVTRDELKRYAKELIPELTSGVVAEIIYEQAGVRSFGAIEDDKIGVVYTALQERANASTEPDLGLDD